MIGRAACTDDASIENRRLTVRVWALMSNDNPVTVCRDAQTQGCCGCISKRQKGCEIDQRNTELATDVRIISSPFVHIIRPLTWSSAHFRPSHPHPHVSHDSLAAPVSGHHCCIRSSWLRSRSFTPRG